MPRAVILDTDIGTDIDDTWALGMLMNCPEVDLKAVVSAHADTEYRASLVAKLLEVWSRTDVAVGVGKVGDALSVLPQSEFLGTYTFEDYTGFATSDGVGLLIDTIMSVEEPVVLSIGPTTNIAAALEREPRIADRASFIGMHGGIRFGYRGSRTPRPEYNVFIDVESFRKVLAADWDVTLTPLDTCGLVYLEGSQYESVRKSDNDPAKSIISNYQSWCKSTKDKDLYQRRSTTLYDTVAVLLALSPEIYEKYLITEDVRIDVNPDGLTVENPEGREVHAAMGWRDLNGFQDFLVDRLL